MTELKKDCIGRTLGAIKNKLRMSGSNQYGPQIIAVTFKKVKKQPPDLTARETRKLTAKEKNYEQIHLPNRRA